MNGLGRVTIKTNRYTYSEEVVEQLSSFAKIHEYDDRKEFKEAWQKWMEEPDIKNLIGSEVARLTANGMTGDILDRMYKSARYYYRKKGGEVANEQPTIRKEYEGLPRTVLKTIDDYIYSEINRNIIAETEKGGNHIITITAAQSFTTYCKLHYDVISDLLPPMNDEEDKVNKNMREELKKVTDRLKKTYKNRFYNIKVSLQDPAVA